MYLWKTMYWQMMDLPNLAPDQLFSGQLCSPLWPGRYLAEITMTSRESDMHSSISYNTGYYCGTEVLGVK